MYVLCTQPVTQPVYPRVDPKRRMKRTIDRVSVTFASSDEAHVRAWSKVSGNNVQYLGARSLGSLTISYGFWDSFFSLLKLICYPG